MAYVWSLVIVAVGLALLVVLVLLALGPVRRLGAVIAASKVELGDKGGMLTARLAALRVRWEERRA